VIAGLGFMDLGRGAIWAVPVGRVRVRPGVKISGRRRVRAAVFRDGQAGRSPGHPTAPGPGGLGAAVKKRCGQRRRWGSPRRLAQASGAR
jgi:hypothetical protein